MYHHVIVGGTFDGLHKGHRYILSQAFAQGERVTIGLTSEAYIKRFKAGQGIRPYEDRKKTLEDWLSSQKIESKVEIVPIDNIFGPALLGDFDAIAVTSQTRENALNINKVRVERGLAELRIIDVPLVPAEDTKPISSSRVRAGEIDREGHLVLPDALRPELQKPLGTVLVGHAIGESFVRNKNAVIATVGDVATKTLLDAGIVPTLSIVDFLVNRKPSNELADRLTTLGANIIHLKSGPGFLSKDALDRVNQWGQDLQPEAHTKTVIIVNGEEDLLTLLAIGHSPLGAVVYYGQPASPKTSSRGGPALANHPSGLVEVAVTPEKKQEIARLLSKFL